ncbi:MAG TPA: tetratricopeptide repeat protein [Thermoanaerobaculia bacterium]|nr:tetratricopeptide repeat protein [Thermoanaerobaculia bacterium]
MFCQSCGCPNPDEQEYCARCHHKLLVLSRAPGADEAEEEDAEEQFSFDEHLLERISIVEEAVKRTAEMMRQVLDALRRQERNILINQTGLASLQELLEQKRLLPREEWADQWQERLDEELLALERRDRFVAVRDRIAALHQSERRDAFLQLLEDAEYAFYALETPRALETLEAAHRLDRDNQQLTWFLGETYFNEGAPDRALPFFSRLLEADPDHYEGLVFSGVIHHERGEPARAQRFLERAVARYPEAFLPHFALGGIHADRGEPARAVEHLDRAVAIDPVPQALYLLGGALYETGRPTAAIRRLRDAVRRDPGFEEAHHLLGLAYLQRRWHKKALESFRQAQRLNPRKMRYQDVVRYLTGKGAPLPEVPGEAGDWLARGEDKLRGRDLKGALRCHRRALALEPANPTVLMSYALVCLELDRGQEIEAVARRVLDLAPGEMLKATATAALMEALRSEGRLAESNRVGQELLEERGSAFSKTIAHYEMSCNYAEMADRAGEGAEGQPDDPLDQALEHARRALEQAPEELLQFPLAALGWIHYKRQELELAIDFLSRSGEVAPSASTLTHLGMALLAAGQDERARDVLAHARTLSGRGEALGARMMALMKDSARLLRPAQS